MVFCIYEKRIVTSINSFYFNELVFSKYKLVLSSILQIPLCNITYIDFTSFPSTFHLISYQHIRAINIIPNNTTANNPSNHISSVYSDPHIKFIRVMGITSNFLRINSLNDHNHRFSHF